MPISTVTWTHQMKERCGRVLDLSVLKYLFGTKNVARIPLLAILGTVKLLLDGIETEQTVG